MEFAKLMKLTFCVCQTELFMFVTFTQFQEELRVHICCAVDIFEVKSKKIAKYRGSTKNTQVSLHDFRILQQFFYHED